MDKYLPQFVAERLALMTGCFVPTKVAYQNFLECLTERERTCWPYWKFLAELKDNGCSVSKRKGVFEIVGRSLLPPRAMSGAMDRPTMSRSIETPVMSENV